MIDITQIDYSALDIPEIQFSGSGLPWLRPLNRRTHDHEYDAGLSCDF
jgi:hypothetical protein